jgi:hypothetical protein
MQEREKEGLRDMFFATHQACHAPRYYSLRTMGRLFAFKIMPDT